MGLCVGSAGRQREASKRDGVEAVHRDNDEARYDTRQERLLSHSFVPFSSLRSSLANVNAETPRKFISTTAEVRTPIIEKLNRLNRRLLPALKPIGCHPKLQQYLCYVGENERMFRYGGRREFFPLSFPK
jgi:hypothetical protein